MGCKLLPLVFAPNDAVKRAAKHYQVSTYAEKVRILTPIVTKEGQLSFLPGTFLALFITKQQKRMIKISYLWVKKSVRLDS